MLRSPFRPARVAGAAAPNLVRLLPLTDLSIRLIPGYPICFLDLAGQLVALAVDLDKHIVRKLAPLLLELARYLFPIALHTIPVHCRLLVQSPMRAHHRALYQVEWNARGELALVFQHNGLRIFCDRLGAFVRLLPFIAKRTQGFTAQAARPSRAAIGRDRMPSSAPA